MIDAKLVTDQAHVLLKDMPLTIFKISGAGSVENFAAIAEIVSDYPDVPLISPLFFLTSPSKAPTARTC